MEDGIAYSLRDAGTLLEGVSILYAATIVQFPSTNTPPLEL